MVASLIVPQGTRIAQALCEWWGAVAQLGERLVRNEEVSGSIPLSSTKESSTYPKLGPTLQRITE